MRRTGLTRMQLRYVESLGLLGHVARSDDRRVFTEGQVALLELIGPFRELGATVEEAAMLANERFGAKACVPDERLAALFDRAIADSQRSVRASVELHEIRRGRRPAA